jgi:O-antigen/teichoic acid export membrane protein
MYTLRYLGSGNYGILSFALAFTAITGFFTDLGLSMIVVRDVSRDRSLTNSYLVSAALIKVGLAAFTVVFTLLLSWLRNYPEETAGVLYIITLSVIISSFAGLFGSVFQAFERMEYNSIGSVLNNLIMLIGALFAISHGLSVLSFAYIYLIAAVAWLAYGVFAFLSKFSISRPSIDFALWRYMIKESLPFGISTIFIRIYYYVDTFMISLLIANPNEIMGWYNAAYRLILVLSFIPSNFLAALYPVMSKCYVSSDNSVQFMFERSFKYLSAIAVPIGVGTTLLSDRIIYFVCGPGYSPSVIALQILVWSEVFIFLNITFGNLLNSTNQQMVVTKQTIGSAMLNIALNLILIPRYSYVGASIATVATELFAFIFLFWFTSKSEYRIHGSMRTYLPKIISASLMMSLFIELFRESNLFLLIVLAAGVYFSTIYFMRFLDGKDVLILKQLIGGLKAYVRKA